MRGSHARTGLSKFAIPIVMVVILVAAGAYVFFVMNPGGPSKTSSSSTGTVPTVPVNDSVRQLVEYLNTRNVDGLMTFYGPNAVDVWSGNTGGLSGQYGTTDSIKLIYATTVGKSRTMSANVSDYSEKVITPTETNTTYLLSILSNSTAAGKVTALVNVTEQWNWVNGGWHITKENWAYTRYDSSFIDAGIPAATTFPQWGYQLKGGNPNLVEEKSFEWHAGPYVAASVYAFLGGVVSFMVLRVRSRGAASDRRR